MPAHPDVITMYQKPACTTCRKVSSFLRDAGVGFDSVNYYLEPLSKKKLKALLGKMGIPAIELVRKKGPVYRKLGLARKKLSDEKLIDLMVQYPDLIQRPIVEKGNRAILARPAATISKIL